MQSRTEALLVGAGALLAAWTGWGAYATRRTETVPYDALDSFDGVELRRYPQSVLVETTASDEGEAFGRLFRYISGANAPGEDVAMTAPVATRDDAASASATTRADGEEMSMTAPVRTVRNGRAGRDATVTMAFYLPADYTPDTAPTPTDPGVRLVVEPPRTLAVRQFSWYATDHRVVRERRHLLDALAERGIDVRGEPTLHQYDDPWTPPFMRRNEMAVAVA